MDGMNRDCSGRGALCNWKTLGGLGTPSASLGIFGVEFGLGLGSDDHFWIAFLGGLAKEPQLSSTGARLAKKMSSKSSDHRTQCLVAGITFLY